jgi:Protein of unknown function (DUF3105)
LNLEGIRRSSSPGLSGAYRTVLVILCVLASLALSTACGGNTPSGEQDVEPEETGADTMTVPEETTGGEAAVEGTTSDEVALTPAEATVGPNENASMLPAGGKEKDRSQDPPENPPEGVRTYPATSNSTDVELPISYEQDPPTNGDHATYWQNCGFYSSPVENEAAVHSMDHGAVWITYRPDLPAEQVEILRGLAQEEYVLVSPYPNLYAPVVATAWRNQLDLTGANDARLRQFVDQFRLSATAPLSGNGCTGGRGEPEVAAA